MAINWIDLRPRHPFDIEKGNDLDDARVFGYIK